MPPKKRGPQTRRSRGKPTDGKDVPESRDSAEKIYRDLLIDVAHTSTPEPERPLKRRKTTRAAPADAPSSPIASDASSLFGSPPPEQREQQTIYADSESDSEPSDLDWEDVDLNDGGGGDADGRAEDVESASSAVQQDISLVLDRAKQKPRPQQVQKRRLPSSALEQKKRLEVHKMHILCLLSHVSMRNSWCNDRKVKKTLRRLLSKRTISYLNPPVADSQFQRSRSFVDGLEQASKTWRAAYWIARRGMRRAQWALNLEELGNLPAPSDMDELHDLSDFQRLANDRAASRDAGAQLFCALLRAAGVEARLICSLQPLPLAPTPSSHTPQKERPTVIWHEEDEDDQEAQSDAASITNDDGAAADRQLRASASPGPAQDARGGSPSEPRRIRRFNNSTQTPRSQPDPGKPPTAATKKPKKFTESAYPIYWVEAFNCAIQRWLPVDPHVTLTIAKATKLEPPASDALNSLTYAVAFSADGTAKDVTRRYAKAYNAKTRRARVEATRGGAAWLARALKLYRPVAPTLAERHTDAIEEAELARREASEPLPRSVQDFKDHPVYALERHLRRNEVLHPKREAGKLSVGGRESAVESIFRRQNVQVVKAADKWYREGREIKAGEQPLKYAAKTRWQRGRRALSPKDDADENDEQQGAGLYALFQTTQFVPPPVVRGKVPRNAYGNLDVYVPSMIPAGGVHVAVPEAAKAARLLGVDYADAVVGFEFKGRQGTAVTRGAIVAQEFQEAVVETVRALRWDVEIKERRKREQIAFRMWKRFAVGLEIRSRIMEYATDDTKLDTCAELDAAEDEQERQREDGGFLPDATEFAAPQPTATKANKHRQHEREPSLSADLDIPNDHYHMTDIVPCVASPWDIAHDRIGVFLHPNELPASQKDLDHLFDEPLDDANHLGGGFIPEYINETAAEPAESSVTDEGGGFIVDDKPGLEDFSTLPSTHARGTAVRDVEVGLHADERRSPDNAQFEAAPEQIQSRGAEPSRKGASANEEHNGERQITADKDAEPDDNESDDQGSLLSHDPEDDEAEPEWLAEDASLLC